MGDKLREEFRTLNIHYVELNYNQINRIVMRTDELIKIRNLIEHCDFEAESTLEKHIVVQATYCWRRCWWIWSKYKSKDEKQIIDDVQLRGIYSILESIVINKNNKLKPTFEEMLTPKDKRFLELLEKEGILEDKDDSTGNKNR